MKTRTIKVELNGEVIKEEFEIPEGWSDRAGLIMASKYAMNNENSAIQVIDRVVNQITEWGVGQGYFVNADEGYSITEEGKFKIRLKDILINQRAAFNSPVWFNVGADTGTNQAAACFVLSIEDTMEDILNHYKKEGLIFKGGSGAGVNVSKLRARGEALSNKGTASGPLSFMRGWDGNAGTIKSAGKVRRAAKLVCMDADHPDIMDFIECKKLEEDKAKILVANGIDPVDAYNTVAFQNTNHSIRVTDEFMHAATNGREEWALVNRGDKKLTYVSAKDILTRTAEIAWETGDPGIQFHDRINRDNPVPSIDKIRGANPCIEFNAIDNSSCNLASLNLVKYFNTNGPGQFNWESFSRDIEIMITAMDILIEAADYPTPEIREKTLQTRPLGLGYSNLGGFLVLAGIKYGSYEAIEYTSNITRHMTIEAYKQSIYLAEKLGSFPAYQDNSNICADIADRLTDGYIGKELILENGLRNSQLTLLAPCGTISLLMDCDTTGIEPLFARKTTKTLSGGGTIEMEPTCIEKCSNPEAIITANELTWKEHIDMMVAAQQHLSSAISKTVNMSSDCTAKDILEAYIYAWKEGIKALAIYRDGSKGMQPLKEVKDNKPKEEIIELTKSNNWTPVRKKLPDTCYGPRHKFNIGGFEGYIRVSTYEDGTPGEIFINASKCGSTIQGLLDSFATAISIGLQYGVPLEKLIDKFTGSIYKPEGYTQNEDIRYARSLPDYIFRWLELEFTDKEEEEEEEEEQALRNSTPPRLEENNLNGDICPFCGGLTQKSGTCDLCTVCGSTTGCS